MKKKSLKLASMALLVVLCLSQLGCKDDEPLPPTTATSSISGITTTGATLNYTVTGTGSLQVVVMPGVSNPNPTQANMSSLTVAGSVFTKKIDIASGSLSGTQAITSLTSNTDYQVFLMTINTDGVNGEVTSLSFKTSPLPAPALAINLSDTTGNGVKMSYTLSASGKLRVVVLIGSDNTTPSQDAMANLTVGGNIFAQGYDIAQGTLAGSVSITGLSAGTSYQVFAMAISPDEVKGDVQSKTLKTLTPRSLIIGNYNVVVDGGTPFAVSIAVASATSADSIVINNLAKGILGSAIDYPIPAVLNPKTGQIQVMNSMNIGYVSPNVYMYILNYNNVAAAYEPLKGQVNPDGSITMPTNSADDGFGFRTYDFSAGAWNDWLSWSTSVVFTKATK